MKDLKLYLIGAAVLLILYITAQYNRPQAVDWNETYLKTEKMPFGTYVLYNRLQDIFAKAQVQTYREPVYNVINDEEISNSNYLIICSSANINEYDYAKLTRYISDGNDVFIAAEDFGDVLEKKLKVKARSEMMHNGQTYINFVNKALGDSTYLVDHGSTNGYFDKFDTLKTVVLGKNGYNHASFIKISMGKGNLYLNANPLVFTNYSLLQPQGASYASKALSYMRVAPGLVWDEYFTRGREGGDSSMRVFLSHYALRWAFYLVLFGLLIFVLFEMKRRQRIIPVIEPVANTTVDFARTVGQVYYEQHDNSNIAQKKVTYFLDYIRQRYNLKTNVQNDEFMKTLSLKSGVDIDLIKELFYQSGSIQTGQPVSNALLIAFNQNTEQFYLQSR